MFFSNNKKIGNNCVRLSVKQYHWLMDVYRKENPNELISNKTYLIFAPNSSKTYFRLNDDLSMYYINED
jgi:hypothetical protein